MEYKLDELVEKITKITLEEIIERIDKIVEETIERKIDEIVEEKVRDVLDEIVEEKIKNKMSGIFGYGSERENSLQFQDQLEGMITNIVSEMNDQITKDDINEKISEVEQNIESQLQDLRDEIDYGR